MRKIREVSRLKAAGVSDRQIAKVIGCVRSTAQECVRRTLDSHDLASFRSGNLELDKWLRDHAPESTAQGTRAQ